MAKIYIKNLKVCTLIGIYEWEQKNKQDVLINLTIEFDASKPSQSDQINDTLDYHKLTEKIIQRVESSQYNLIEKLSQSILDIVMIEPLVLGCSIRVDKPLALKTANSVAVELTEQK
ncbi:hypothetical protein MNBD_BACTEROID05-41 [hydrothermal vent metagenome]|uniref:Dihydroneopterin triphosphate 2'-epimerase n=1 Tax=hydrothermal vent metagenome TaxID=652676 RepID=A0A3B0T8F3_9ZZZZ